MAVAVGVGVFVGVGVTVAVAVAVDVGEAVGVSVGLLKIDTHPLSRLVIRTRMSRRFMGLFSFSLKI